MPKFRKKPVVIEAEQFFAYSEPWPEGVENFPLAIHTPFCILTLEGRMQVSDGDWIITGVKGERYPCKLDIFEATYEEVLNGE